MSVYAAIDLHSNNSVLAVLDECDRVLCQRRRLPNELPVILRELEPFHEELAGVVIESTYNWYWLVDGLMDLTALASSGGTDQELAGDLRLSVPPSRRCGARSTAV